MWRRSLQVGKFRLICIRSSLLELASSCVFYTSLHLDTSRTSEAINTNYQTVMVPASLRLTTTTIAVRILPVASRSKRPEPSPGGDKRGFVWHRVSVIPNV